MRLHRGIVAEGDLAFHGRELALMVLAATTTKSSFAPRDWADSRRARRWWLYDPAPFEDLWSKRARSRPYINGKKSDESKGTWSLKGNQFVTKTRSSRYRTTDESAVRRVNRNKFVATGKNSDGSRSTATYTRK